MQWPSQNIAQTTHAVPWGNVQIIDGSDDQGFILLTQSIFNSNMY